MGYKLSLSMQLLSPRFRYQTGRVSLTALLVLVALVLLAQTSVPAHVHSDGEAGIYNAQCPLAESATAQREFPLSAVAVAGCMPLVAPPLVFSPTTRPPDSPLDLAASRAPPLA